MPGTGSVPGTALSPELRELALSPELARARSCCPRNPELALSPELAIGLEDLVIGIVAPIGTCLDSVDRTIDATLERLGDISRHVRLTDYLHEV